MPSNGLITSKALEKKSEDRYQSAAEFAHALQAVLNGATEVPPFYDGVRPAMGSQGNVPTPLAQQAVAVAPAPMSTATRSSPLPRQRASTKPSIGLLVGIAFGFLVVGAVLAAIVLKLVMK